MNHNCQANSQVAAIASTAAPSKQAKAPSKSAKGIPAASDAYDTNNNRPE